MDNQTNQRKSQAVGAPFLVENPCLAPSHIGPSTERSNGIFPENNSTVDQEQSSEVFDPQSLIIPGYEDEDYDLDLQQLLMADFCTTSDEFMPYLNPSPLHNGNSNDQPNQIVGGFSENNIMDIGSTSYFNNPYWDRPPLDLYQLDERSKNMCMVGQSYQINYLTGAAIEEPSSEAVAPPSTAVLAVENGRSTTICQPIMFDRQIMGIPLAFPAVGYPPSTSYCPLDNGFGQNNILHTDPFDASSTSITKLQEYHFTDELKRISENGEEPPDNGKKRRKPNDGRRRCGCKKSKCIQRYCECFYSGVFCDDQCGCEGCNNTIEHGPSVFKKREDMKRKNSLAFTSKIEQVEEGSEPQGIARKTKRHRRGCSCAKTKCLQKYCECYQAHVKCSDRCRCQGCGNIETREQDAATENFVTGEAMNSGGFHINAGRMLPQANASYSSIRRQTKMASTSSVVPLQQWLSRASTSVTTSTISNLTFWPRLLQPMKFNDILSVCNGTSLMVNYSRFPARVNSLDREWVPAPRFSVPEAGSGMSIPPLPPLIPSDDADARSNGQGNGEKNKEG